MISWNWGILKDSWQKRKRDLMGASTVFDSCLTHISKHTSSQLSIIMNFRSWGEYWKTVNILILSYFLYAPGPWHPALPHALSLSFILSDAPVTLGWLGSGHRYYTRPFFCRKTKWVAQVIPHSVSFIEILFLMRWSRNTETFLLLTCKWHIPQQNCPWVPNKESSHPTVSRSLGDEVLGHFSRVWLCDPMDCNPPSSSVHGILQAKMRKSLPKHQDSHSRSFGENVCKNVISFAALEGKRKTANLMASGWLSS